MREYALRGEERLREGSPQQAMGDFKSAFRAAPSEITDRVFSQYIFPMPMAMSAFGYRAESAELMGFFEDRFQNDVNRLIQIGFFYVQIEAPLEAVRTLERAVQLAPQNSRAHNSLGTAYLINLRLDESLAEFRRALELDPKDEYANLNLANAYRARGSMERAIDHYRKQLTVNPDDAEAHGGLAIALLAVGRDEEAEREIARALELGPDNYRFLTQLAYFYATRKKLVIARTTIERAGRIEPRYTWSHLTKANIDLLEGKFGDALATLLPAQNLGSFPTIGFEVAKALMSLDGYDQAVEIMSKSFKVTADGEFEALLGGVMKARSPRLELLLERERQASLFLNDQTTTGFQYTLAEALLRTDHYANALRVRKSAAARTDAQARARSRGRGAPARGRARSAPPRPEEQAEATRPRRARNTVDPDAELSAGSDAALPGMAELLKALTTFTTLDDGRQAFRMVWASKKLADNGVALDAAEQLARRAIAIAEQATEPDGSMRDAPLLDRQGRLEVFRGRAHDALGWTLLKKGDTRGAISELTLAAETYPPNAERRGVLWRLGVAMEEVGDEQRALDFYISGFEPTSPAASARRAHIEVLYKKIKGSLDGLEQLLKQP
jgi:tetratricopeptide (TPR) repeat protein